MSFARSTSAGLIAAMLASVPFPTSATAECCVEADHVEAPVNDDAPAREAAVPPAAAAMPRVAPDNAASQPVGALTGRIVYVNGGHGWTALTGGTWSTQRGINSGMIEDLGNIDQMTAFVHYAFNAGATVVPFRPVGYQTNEVVIDNDDPQATFTPDVAWGSSTNAQYFGGAGDAVHYRFATIAAAETATARYTPSIPQAGFYPVYAWTRDGVDRVEDQLYRIVHTGGSMHVRINHRRVGKGWIYLGTYHFDAGTAGYVEISNASQSTTGTVVVADAIRFGNGMGDIDRGAGVSGKAREDEASRYWVQAGLGQGASTDIYDQAGLNDTDDNVSTPTRMTAWMNAEGEGPITDRIFLSFHSNATDPGSLGLYNGNNLGDAASTPNQERWAEIVASELNGDLSALVKPPEYESAWPDRVALGLSLTLDRTDIEFGEIRGDRINDEMDATIIEVAAHGNANEALLMRDVRVREAIARASVQAMVKYFNEFGGGGLFFQPAAPTHVSAVANGDGTATVSWQAAPSDPILGHPPAGYVVYRSANGYGFGSPTAVAGIAASSYTFGDVAPGTTAYFRVAATNAGGESPASEVVAVHMPAPGSSAPRALIVNGFDRRDRFQNPTQVSTGTFDRVIPRRINSGDYVVQHAEALAAVPVIFDSCANEAATGGAVALGDYDAVFWILGEESTTTETFSAAERALVSAYLAAGGRLFVSGAEIGWHLEAQGADVAFYNSVLRTDYVGDDANTYSASGDGGSILAGIVGIDFSPTADIYDANFPDIVTTTAGSTRIMSYGTGFGAGIAHADGATGSRVVVLAFPFETIRNAPIRAEIMHRVADFFQIRSDGGDMWMMR